MEFVRYEITNVARRNKNNKLECPYRDRAFFNNET